MPARKDVHPKSLENLKKGMAKKGGTSKGGRPKGSISVSDSIARALQDLKEGRDPDTGKMCKKAVRDWIGIALTQKAMDGDVAAIREILDRIDGKATQKIEMTGKDGEPLKVEHSKQLEAAYENMKEAFGEVVKKGKKK